MATDLDPISEYRTMKAVRNAEEIMRLVRAGDSVSPEADRALGNALAALRRQHGVCPWENARKAQAADPA